MKTIKFSKDGNTVRIFDYDDKQVTDKLAPAVYSIDKNLFGFYLTIVSEKFTIPSTIYGSTGKRAEKILKTYDDREASTGVLLTGDKGAGKTLLTSMIGNSMIERGLPVIMIEKPFAGTDFNEFINNIGESMLMFDEFGKVFSGNPDDDDNSDQNGLLSVFDGARAIKRLIVLTENETHKVNSYILNRPGRVFYHFKYNKVDEDTVREFCSIHEIPEGVIQSILIKVDASWEFSFDALKAVVEEYKRYGGEIKEVFESLNIEEGKESSSKMKVTSIINAQTGESYESITKEVSYPMDNYRDRIMYKTGERIGTGDEERDQIVHADVDLEDLVERTSTRHVYKLEKKNVVVILDKIEPKPAMGYSQYLDYQ